MLLGANFYVINKAIRVENKACACTHTHTHAQKHVSSSKMSFSCQIWMQTICHNSFFGLKVNMVTYIPLLVKSRVTSLWCWNSGFSFFFVQEVLLQFYWLKLLGERNLYT